MKYSFFFLVLAFLLISCNTAVNPRDNLTATGVVQKIEMSAWQYGTHTLNDSNGRPLYALKSSTIDLNVYDNKLVEVSGTLISGYPVDGGPKYLNVTDVTIIK